MAGIPAPLIKRMSLDMLKERIIGDPDWATRNGIAISNRLADIVSEAGNVWDLLNYTNPNDGPEVRHGTRNRESMTYVMRKAAGFAYP